jgi:DNA (cytosine-5)-methyltransferase 1
MNKLTVLDLFSGIGGFSLGLERTGGFETIQFCEFDPKAQLVLKKHWPDVPIHDDIRTISPEPFSADVVCGGFPCQDISSAGRGVGIIGERSGLWSEMARVIGVVRPKWVIAENVSALRSKGLALVLQDLDALGYDAEWHCIPASAIGAPHRRDRVWVIARNKISNPYPRHHGRSTKQGGEHEGAKIDPRGSEDSLESGTIMAYPKQSGTGDESEPTGGQRGESSNSGEAAIRQGDGEALPGGTDATGSTIRNPDGHGESALPVDDEASGVQGDVADSTGHRSNGRTGGEYNPQTRQGEVGTKGGPYGGHWTTEPDVGRVAHGVPGRVDRLKQLGNAIVPQIATLIGQKVLDMTAPNPYTVP